MKEFLKSEKFKHIIIGVGIFLGAFVLFEAGMLTGYNKAFFSYKMGEDYYRTFDADDIGIMPMGPGHFINTTELPNQNGATGEIVKIALPVITVADKDGVEKNVLIDDDTIIRHFRETLKPADLALDNYIIVIGSPNDKSQILAKLIRILPSPFSSNSSNINPANISAPVTK